MDLEFNLNTGIGNSKAGDYPCIVNSIQEVPENIYNLFHQIDRKYRLRNTPEGARLLDDEIQALRFAGKHYYTG
jgi:hypothetical protein